MPRGDRKDFGPATSKHLNLYKKDTLFVHESGPHVFEFTKIQQYKNGVIRVRCIGCYKLQQNLKRKGDLTWKDLKLARASVFDGRFVSDDPANPSLTGGNAHICLHEQTKPKVVMKQSLREQCLELRDNPVRPNKAHHGVAKKIIKAFEGDVDGCREAIDTLEHLRFRKRTFERNTRHGLQPIHDFTNNPQIPESLLVLKEYLSEASNDYLDSVDRIEPHKRMALYFAGKPDKPFVVLMSETMLEYYKDCELLGLDGTFDSASKEFGQLYVGAAIREEYGVVDDTKVCIRSEGVPLFYAEMPDRTTESYTKLFDIIRSAAAKKGPIVRKTVKTDMEPAAVKAWKRLNNKINTMFDRVVHPELDWALHLFQIEIMLIDSRIRVIAAGGEHARPFARNQDDIAADVAIIKLEQQFYANAVAHNMDPAVDDIMRYLRAQSCHLGTCSERTRRERRQAQAAAAVANQNNTSLSTTASSIAADDAVVNNTEPQSHESSGLPSAGPEGSCTTVNLQAQAALFTSTMSVPAEPVATSTPQSQHHVPHSSIVSLEAPVTPNSFVNEIQYLKPVTVTGSPVDDLRSYNDSVDLFDN